MLLKLKTTARVSEVADTADRLLKRYQLASEISNDTFLKTLFGKINELYQRISEAINRGISYSELEAADSLRDEKIRALDKVLVGYKNLPLEEAKTHAERLYAVFSKYGVKITQENYVNESGLIEAPLKDLSAEDLQPSITALSGVRECIEQLRQAQEAFNQKRLNHEQQNSQETASLLKKPLLAHINDELLQYLKTMIMVNPTQYKAFADAVAETIETTNEVVKRRKKEDPKKI